MTWRRDHPNIKKKPGHKKKRTRITRPERLWRKGRTEKRGNPLAITFVGGQAFIPSPLNCVGKKETETEKNLKGISKSYAKEGSETVDLGLESRGRRPPESRHRRYRSRGKTCASQKVRREESTEAKGKPPQKEKRKEKKDEPLGGRGSTRYPEGRGKEAGGFSGRDPKKGDLQPRGLGKGSVIRRWGKSGKGERDVLCRRKGTQRRGKTLGDERKTQESPGSGGFYFSHKDNSIGGGPS